MIAKRISEATSRGEALAEIAKKLALSDPDRALAIAKDIPDETAVQIPIAPRRIAARSLFHYYRRPRSTSLPGAETRRDTGGDREDPLHQ